jgi:hypothetical protein
MTQRLTRSSRTPGLRFAPLKTATPDSTKSVIAGQSRPGGRRKQESLPAEDGEAEIGKGRYDGNEHQLGRGHHGHQALTISLHMRCPIELIGTLDLQRPRSRPRSNGCTCPNPVIPGELDAAAGGS